MAVQRQVDGANDVIKCCLTGFGEPDDGELQFDRRPVQVLGGAAERAGGDEIIALPVGVIAIEMEHVLPGRGGMRAEPAGVLVVSKDSDALVLPPAR